MKIKEERLEKYSVIEQMGRIPLGASGMYFVIKIIELGKITEFLSVILILLWMIRPTIDLIKDSIK